MSDIGQTLGDRYNLLELIGQGGAARVYRARDLKLNRTVAVKVLHQVYDSSETVLSRFQREAESMARLSHPNLLTVHDVGRTEDGMYLVMELAAGKSLADLLKEGKEDLPTRISLLEKTSRGLAEAHRHGIVHRDIKPSNIMITLRMEPRLGDFGLAHLRDSDQAITRSDAPIGTPKYMAPEQVDGKEVTTRTDVHALGIVLYEILTGEVPYDGRTVAEIFAKVARSEPAPPRSAPANLVAITFKALEKDPERRYADAGDFADDLARYLAGEPVLARPVTPMGALLRKVARKKTALAVGATAILLAAVLTLVFLPRGTEKKTRSYVDSGRTLLGRLDRLLTDENADRKQIDAIAENARTEFRKALQIHPRHVGALLEMARLERLVGNPKECERYATLAIDADPKFLHALLERAMIRLDNYAIGLITPNTIKVEETPRLQRLRLKIQEDLEVVSRLPGSEEELAYANGILKFAREDFDGAAKDIRAYAQAMVTDARAWYFTGVALFLSHRLRESLDALEQAMKFRPRYLSIQLIMGTCHHVQGVRSAEKGDRHAAADHWSRGVRRMDRMLEISPNYTAATATRGILHKKRGVLRMESGDKAGAAESFSAALADYNRVIEVDPTDFMTLNNRANLHHLLGNHEQSLKDYDRAIELRSDFDMLFTGRAALRTIMGDHEGAIADATTAIELEPNNDSAWNNRGMAKHSLKDIAGALADYTQALRIRPGSTTALLNRGTIHEEMGNLDLALDDYSEAIRNNPAAWRVYNSRGNILSAQRKFEAAIRDFSEAIKLKADYAYAFNGRGLAHDEMGHNEEAFRDFNKAIEVDPAYATPHFNKGRLYQKLDRFEEAVGSYAAAIRVRPGYVKAWQGRARARILLLRWNDALGDTNQLIRMDPGKAEYYMLRGRCLLELGRVNDAEQDLNEAIRLDPGEPFAHAFRGDLFLRTKRYAKAAADFRTALKRFPKSDPNHGVVLNKLKQAERN